MERLTKKIEHNGKYYLSGLSEVSNIYPKGYGRIQVGRAVDKLAEYEDLEEQGKLPKLPVAVGDTVYSYCSVFGILAYTVDCIVIDENITFQCSSYSEPIGDYPSECLDEIEPDISDFGKTVFLTIELAGATLKELSTKIKQGNQHEAKKHYRKK